VAVERTNGRSEGKRIHGASPPFAGNVSLQWPPQKLSERGIYLSCGSSAATGLAAGSVDLVVTDPPFFDNVHYSELADFFFAWQQLEPSPFTQNRRTTRHPEEVQDVSEEQFAAKLRAVFSECRRVLKDDGLLVFTYHHSRANGWTALADAVIGAGLTMVNCHPVKAEMSVAAPKYQAKEPIQLDVILVCRKQSAVANGKQDVNTALGQAIAHAKAKATRLQHCGFDLSANDRRVILISQFLVEICSGRSATRVADALSEKLTDLDLAAFRLLESGAVKAPRTAQVDERQMALLERPAAKEAKIQRRCLKL
jgi:putative DNA methylase